MKRLIAIACILAIMPLCISAYAQDVTSENNETVRIAGTLYESESNNNYSVADRTQDDYNSYGTISTTADIDWWVVRFSFSGYANFWLGDIPEGCDYDLKLYASDGTTLLKSSCKVGNASELISEYWVTPDVDYYVRIYSVSGSTNASNYLFRAKNYWYSQYAGVYVSSLSKGISAKITIPSSLPDVSDSGESVWVSSNRDSNKKWIQAGACYYSSYSNFKTYTECFQDGTYNKTIHGVHIQGVQVSYSVEYSAVDQKWHAYIAGYDKASSVLATTNIGVQAQAEVHKKEIEMGPFTFSEVKVKNTTPEWKNNTVYPTASSPYAVTGSATQFTVSGP